VVLDHSHRRPAQPTITAIVVLERACGGRAVAACYNRLDWSARQSG